MWSIIPPILVPSPIPIHIPTGMLFVGAPIAMPMLIPKHINIGR